MFERWSYVSSAIDQARINRLPIQVSFRPGMPLKERKVSSLVNIRTSLELGIYNSSINEGLAGLLERVCFVADGAGGWRSPPSPERGFFERLFADVLDEGKLYLYPVSQLSVEEFLCRYKGAKRSTYERAAKEFNDFGLDKKKHTFVGAFVKDERQQFGKAPRLIRPFHPVFNLAFGTFVYPLEKCLYSAIDGLYGCPTVTKGLNGTEVAKAIHHKWSMFSDPVCLITDMSRFDQHCSVEAMRLVRDLCSRALSKAGANVREFVELWTLTEQTRGMVLCDDGVVSYRVRGGLNSGLSSTSLCGVTIVCLLLRAYCLSVGVNHQLISAGDDTNVIIEKVDLPLFADLPAFCLRAGFTVKIDGVAGEMEQIDFCQARPVWDGLNWVMVRDPRVVVTKDLLTSKRFSREGDIARYARAISDCGISLCGGIPVMQSFYLMLRRAAGNVKATALERNGFYFLCRNMDRGVSGVTNDARVSFYKAFGMDVWRQQTLEAYFDGLVVDWSGVESGRTFSSDITHAFEKEN